MKRWNGWGNINTNYPVPVPARNYLTTLFGTMEPPPDAAYETVLKSVPKSRLPFHVLVDATAQARLSHACGQSTPDWVALRSGRIPAFPDGVAFPKNEEQVRELIAYAQKSGAVIIPYGGGTSVVGHINPLKSSAPVLTLSMERMTRMLDLDEFGCSATFEAGVKGPDLEASLKEKGYTLGHYPQSHEYSTLGGWIVTRSSGQQSYKYGRIEQMFAGGRMETPHGTLDIPHFPASAAGPDIKELILGSEGRMGIITQAKVKIRRVPDAEEFFGVFFPSWEQGTESVRHVTQEEIPVSMLRLSNPQETETTLILSGKSWVGMADKGLRLVGYKENRCLLVFGVTGSVNHVRRTRAQSASVFRKFGGLFVGTIVGHTWEKSRFLSPYLRNTLWDLGVAIDTLETAIPWKNIALASAEIPASISKSAGESGQKVLAFAHLSHIYRDGASIYTTFLFPRPNDPDELLHRWQAIKMAASLTIQRFGGTISHQHGVGTDHAPFLPAEKGTLGMDAIRAVCRSFDPDGIMNPGKLFLDKC